MQFDQSIEIPDDEAKAIICKIVADGILILSHHAKEQMAERGYSLQDVVLILLNGEIVKKEYKDKTQIGYTKSKVTTLKTTKGLLL